MKITRTERVQQAKLSDDCLQREATSGRLMLSLLSDWFFSFLIYGNQHPRSCGRVFLHHYPDRIPFDFVRENRVQRSVGF